MKYFLALTLFLVSAISVASNTPTVFNSNVLQIGDGTSASKQFKVKMSGTTPYLQYNTGLSQWVFSNDGATSNPIGAGNGGATNVVGTVGSPQLVTAGSGVSITSQIINGPNMVFVAGNAGPVTVTATPSMTACTSAGEFVTLVGTSGANTVTLQADSILPGSKLKMANSFSLADGGTAQFVCDDVAGFWRLTSLVQSYITATGGTITTDGNFKVHTFTSGGTFTVLSGSTNTAEVLVVGGGGGGGSNNAGGGGAGGAIDNSNVSLAPGTYTVTIGAGGTGGLGAGVDGQDGNSSIFQGLTTAQGGGGGSSTNVPHNGGSGGGTGFNYNGVSTGVGGQGFAGGTPGSHFVACDGSLFSGAGGGGATGIGQGGCGTAPVALQGGPGITTSISGAPVCYAGGGNGGFATGTDPGGQCGGGIGGQNATTCAGGNGTVNTGGGAGGSCNSGNAGGNGGSGIVIVRYRFQ